MLRGIGAASVVAPSPNVFCDVNGLEGFASTFTLQFRSGSGPAREIAITPELYSRLRGPYDRRNAYGAALSYGPKLPDSLWRSVYDYGWKENGPLRRELGIPNENVYVVTVIRTETRGRHDCLALASQRRSLLLHLFAIDPRWLQRSPQTQRPPAIARELETA
ncbi:MAG TPA: hypothetical protein VGF73_05295 [Chthoniobacterales bacterium]